eukprot:TRINITY_DN11821_c0_g1_i1.p1 TRINITY_DN11821_c0_g1~~TRINITY_DN11821_c0_g1_i1.p1  ORF type:complete len:148 (-),score=31.69 TRINITY_DN11821_c0_g1_i1:60-503(-)
MTGMLFLNCFFFFMIRRPPRSTQGVSSAASDVYKRQINAEYMGMQFNSNELHFFDFSQKGRISTVKLDLTLRTVYQGKVYTTNSDPGSRPIKTFFYKGFLFIMGSTNVLKISLKRSEGEKITTLTDCLLYTSPSPRDLSTSRMPSSA